jgi:hypothetical protein
MSIMLTYVVRPGSLVNTVMDEMATQDAQREKALLDWWKSAGIPEGAKLSFMGASFDSVDIRKCTENAPKMPKGFRLPFTRSTTWKLDWKTPEGKKLGNAFRRLPQGSDDSAASTAIFEHGLSITKAPVRGFLMHHAVFYDTKRGRVIALDPSVKRTAKHWPKGLSEITASKALTIIQGPDWAKPKKATSAFSDE